MPENMNEPPEQPQPTPEHGATGVSNDTAAARHNRRNIALIIGREYKGMLARRSFRISTIILIALVVIAAFIPTILQLFSAPPTSSQTNVVVVNEAGSIGSIDAASLVAYIGSQLNGTSAVNNPPYIVTSEPSADLASLQDQVKNGKLGILLVLDRTSNQNLHMTYYTNSSAPNDSNLSSIQGLASLLSFMDTAKQLGLSPAQIESILAPPNLTVVNTEGVRQTDQTIAGYVLGFGGGILIYVAVAFYGNIVATGVAVEKSSRVMEVLLNAATPFQLLAGKIAGIGAACLTQMAGIVVAGIAALLLQIPLQSARFGAGSVGFAQYLVGISVPVYLLLLLYFILAFFLYAGLFAGFGALASRQEEVQTATAVPTMLIVLGWLAMYTVVISPNALWVKALSYVPFFSPMMMLTRLGFGTVEWWEIPVTVVIMLVSIFASAWFAARLYRFGVLMYGQRPGLGGLVRLARMK
jgi:ABC-2 type transport system permease protein